MLTIAKLFGKSPFSSLLIHMDKVSLCIDQLPKLFAAVQKQETDLLQELMKTISRLEHEADLTKNDIRNHLPKSLFLPIEKGQLLEILSLQDAIADKAEDIAIVASLKPLFLEKQQLKEIFSTFCSQSLDTFWVVHTIVQELDTLLESSFGGMEAEKVKQQIESVGKKEHEIDRLQSELLKLLYQKSHEMHFADFYHWTSMIKEVGSLSNVCEKLANRFRVLLDI